MTLYYCFLRSAHQRSRVIKGWMTRNGSSKARRETSSKIALAKIFLMQFKFSQKKMSLIWILKYWLFLSITRSLLLNYLYCVTIDLQEIVLF